MIGNDILQYALKEVGNGGKKYCKWYGYDYVVDWCMIFVSYVFVKKKSKQLIGSVTYNNVGIFDDYCRTSSNMKKIKDHTKAEKGDLCIYSWNGTQRNHIGIVEDTSKNYIWTVEGNTGNDNCMKSKVMIRKRNKRYIYAIYRPTYTLSFEDQVNAYLAGNYTTTDKDVIKKAKEISKLADKVLAGKYGNGEERKKRLGNNYALVQNEVNRRLNNK